MAGERMTAKARLELNTRPFRRSLSRSRREWQSFRQATQSISRASAFVGAATRLFGLVAVVRQLGAAWDSVKTSMQEAAREQARALGAGTTGRAGDLFAQARGKQFEAASGVLTAPLSGLATFLKSAFVGNLALVSGRTELAGEVFRFGRQELERGFDPTTVDKLAQAAEDLARAARAEASFEAAAPGRLSELIGQAANLNLDTSKLEEALSSRDKALMAQVVQQLVPVIAARQREFERLELD